MEENKIEFVTCPCCGARETEPGRGSVCPVCFWESDPLQLADPEYTGGANRVSLRQARENYATFGACELRFRRIVRPAAEPEKKQ